jgi:hypothetical protein
MGGRASRASGSFTSLFSYGSKYGAAVAYSLAALALVIGWLGRDSRNLVAGEGLGYWLGIVGGVAMAVLPLYSARKRMRLFNWMGPIRHWFKAHMGLGIFGPLVILYHSNFQLGDLNSKIALYCALLVAGSGIVGRYLYGKIHLGLYGRKMTLTDLTKRVRESLDRTDNGLFKPLYEQLAVIDRDVIHDAETLGAAALRPVAVAWKTWVVTRKLDREIVDHLSQAAKASPTVADQRTRLESMARRYVRDHLKQVRAVALFGFYERAFSLWHMIHLPFFFMLILSAIVHVIAVHLY